MFNRGGQEQNQEQVLNHQQSEYVGFDELRARLTSSKQSDLVLLNLAGGRAPSPTEHDAKPMPKSDSKESFASVSKKISWQTQNKDKQLKQLISHHYIGNLELFWTHYQEQKRDILLKKDQISDRDHEILENDFKSKLFKLLKLKPRKIKELSLLLFEVPIKQFYEYTFNWMTNYLNGDKMNSEESFKNDYLNSLKVFVKSLQPVDTSNNPTEFKSAPVHTGQDTSAVSDVKISIRDRNNNVIQKIRQGQEHLALNWKLIKSERETFVNERDKAVRLAERAEDQDKKRVAIKKAEDELIKNLRSSPPMMVFKELVICEFYVKEELSQFPELAQADPLDLLNAVNSFITEYLKQSDIDFQDFRVKYAALLHAFPNHKIDEILRQEEKPVVIRSFRVPASDEMVALYEKNQNELKLTSSPKGKPLEGKLPAIAEAPSLWEKIKTFFRNLFCCCWGGGGDSKPQNVEAKPPMPPKPAQQNRSNFRSSRGWLSRIFGTSSSLEYPPAEPMRNTQIFTQADSKLDEIQKRIDSRYQPK